MAEQQTRQPILQNQARQALQNGAELTDEQKKAIRAGSARAFYADLPGAFTDIAGTALDYGAEGLARLLPSDLAGYDLPKSLGIRGFQRAMRDPALGSKQLERLGEKAGYIPPTTGTQEEEMARLFMGLADPMPLPAGMTSRVFSSPAVKAVSEIKQNKMPANQWISQMKSRGVKQDELTWTGVEDWLKSQKGSVTKQELDEYLDANQIQVQEVVKGTADQSAKDAVIRKETAEELNVIKDNDQYLYENDDVVGPLIDRYETGDLSNQEIDQLNEYFSGYRNVDTGEPAIKSIERKNIEYFDNNPGEFERKAGGQTQYGRYTLPGGENYRELLLTLPSKRTADPEKRYEELMRIVDRRAPTEAESLEMEVLENQMTGRSGSVGRDFISGHYKEPNIVAHIRFNERVDADGNKVLFIEEIQSDWAQAGRKKGFSPANRDIDQEITDINKEINQISRSIDNIDSQYRNLDIDESERNLRYRPLKEEYDALLDKRDELVKQVRAVPAAPFVMDTNQWTSLALKRMVRWATDNGFDEIAWTTGKQQAKRYDLSKQVDEISYRKNKDGTYFLLIRPKGSNSALDTIQNQSMKSVPEEKLEDIIGKELAKKMVNKEGEEFANLAVMNDAETQEDMIFRKFTGVDLEVGGEGMGAYYDKILVDRAKKLGKQYGSKVDKGQINSEYVASIFQPSLGRHEDIARGTEERVNEIIKNDYGPSFISPDGQFTGKIRKEGDEVWTMNLTDKLKKAAVDGLPYYVALPPRAAGTQREMEKNQMNQIQAQQNAQRINAQ